MLSVAHSLCLSYILLQKMKMNDTDQFKKKCIEKQSEA